MSDNDSIKRGDALKMGFECYLECEYGIFVQVKEVIENIRNLPAVPQEMSAREYLEAEARMCRYYGLPCAFDASGLTVDGAIEMVEKFAREHPEEANDGE